ncbi:conserved hypothetical protein [Burkholderia sp. 8Y]|uniref:hypothetical protein n=1 Tax=Burkholderia sp. 8Y TaxID=2653133 RepID=UPI0012F0D5D6|nr:hypothetical protein [Burkholderia sp. 8Y]VXC51249.1 conserved hypothetical protein [Burkholderia sp. 8Y]
MAWIYSYLSNKGTHKETGTVFTIEYARNTQSKADITIRPTSGPRQQFSITEIETLKDELWAALLDERRRTMMRSLVENEFAGDRQYVASVISRFAARNVSARTVQAWLIEPGKASSRFCPEWAMKALLEYLSKPENQERLRARKEYKERQPWPQKRTVLDVADKHAVQFATTEIERDERMRKAWTDTTLGDLPSKLFELERRMTERIRYLEDRVSGLTSALKNGKSFDEYRAVVLDELNNRESEDYEVRKTRLAIEAQTGEFAHPEGLASE